MKKFTSVGLVIALTLALTGCGGSNQPQVSNANPQDIIREMIGNSQTTKFDMKKGKLVGNVEVEVKNATKGTFNLRADVDSQFDVTNLQNLIVDLGLKLSGKGAIEGQNLEGNVDTQIKILDKKLYLTLKGLDIKNDNPKDKENVDMLLNIVKPYLNKWYYTELPADFSFKSDFQTLSDEQRNKITTIVQDAKIFDVTKDNGIVNGNFDYDVTVNMSNVMDMGAKISQELSSKDAPTEAELVKAKENVKNVVVAGKLLISTDSKKLRGLNLTITGQAEDASKLNLAVDVKTPDEKQFQGTLEIKDLENNPANNVKITFDLNVDKDAPVNITAPADATSIAELMGSMSPASATTTPVEDVIPPTSSETEGSLNLGE